MELEKTTASKSPQSKLAALLTCPFNRLNVQDMSDETAAIDLESSQGLCESLAEDPNLNRPKRCYLFLKQHCLAALNFVFPRSATETSYQAVGLLCALLAVLALLDLAVRASLRLEPRWDTVWYHLPFAALRGGIGVPYEMNTAMMERYQGFPFLAHFVQGLFWRLTGSVNATGVVNYLAFAAFLAYCHMALRANIWLVALISLTAPMVLIHSTCSYVDLFGNSFLAIGLSASIFLYLFPARATKTHVLCGLGGLIAAAWTKYLIVPIVGLGFMLMLLACFSGAYSTLKLKRSQIFWLIFAAALIAALPYIKNFFLYKNPFWPVRVPFFTDLFPYTEGWEDPGAEKPPHLADSPQYKIFFHSLFEIDHPTRYPGRERWILDQGNAAVSFRMGGFWSVGAVFYLSAMMFMLWVSQLKKGFKLSLVILAVLCFNAILPQSHQLRYFMYIPLTWAATLCMVLPAFKEKLPRTSVAFLCAVLGLFGYMVKENWAYYQVERIDYAKLAAQWGAQAFWSQLQQGQTYCAVDVLPFAMLLTGPTLHEYTIIEKDNESQCPKGSTLVTREGFRNAKSYLEEGFQQFSAGHYEGSIERNMKALQLRPDYAEAYNNICISNINLGRFDAAITACTSALKIDPDYTLARNNLTWALSRKQAGW